MLPDALATRLKSPTPTAMAGAGLVTNLPGLYYIAALVAVLQTHPSPVGGIAQVLVYNLLRFAVPVAVLVLVILRPDRTLELVRAVHAWGRRHATVLLVLAVGGVGIYLTGKGVLGADRLVLRRQPGVVGEQGQLGAVVQVELGQRARQVGLDRARARAAARG